MLLKNNISVLFLIKAGLKIAMNSSPHTALWHPANVHVNVSALMSSFPRAIQRSPRVFMISVRNEFFFIFMENLIRCNWVKSRIDKQSLLVWVQVYTSVIRRGRWTGSSLRHACSLQWAPPWPNVTPSPARMQSRQQDLTSSARASLGKQVLCWTFVVFFEEDKCSSPAHPY